MIEGVKVWTQSALKSCPISEGKTNHHSPLTSALCEGASLSLPFASRQRNVWKLLSGVMHNRRGKVVFFLKKSCQTEKTEP